MGILGWVLFGAICLFAVAGIITAFAKHFKLGARIIAIVVAAALCVGAYFGANAIFKNKEETVEEPVIEETVEEAVEEPAEEG